MSLRLHSAQRIRKADIFSVVKKRGKFIRGSFINVWVYEKLSPDISPKIGLIVSRKVSKRANQRNLWKRRMREVFRRNQNIIRPMHWILMQAKAQESVAPYTGIENEFLNAIGKAGALIITEK